MRINLFYPAVLMIGVALYFLLQPPGQDAVSFFGFAESNETAINYNYPVVVNDILVRPGEPVREGQPLLEVSRRKAKETLADQDYRIAELASEERLYQTRKQDQLAELRARHETKLLEIDQDLTEAQRKLSNATSLLEGLQTVRSEPGDYQPLRNRIQDLKVLRARTQVQNEREEAAITNQLRLGGDPYRARTERIRAEAAFDSTQREIPFTVTAPADGLVGNIQVKEDEHVPSYETLLSFYEPHSTIVSGYLHEDQTPKVNLGDRFEVYSLKDATVRYPATSIGLGSRIVSIPTRLRELPTFETYGREVILEIPADNVFLQKEKVGIRLIAANTERE